MREKSWTGMVRGMKDKERWSHKGRMFWSERFGFPLLPFLWWKQLYWVFLVSSLMKGTTRQNYSLPRRVSTAALPLMWWHVLCPVVSLLPPSRWCDDVFFAPSCLYCRPPADVMTYSLPRRVSTAALPLMWWRILCPIVSPLPPSLWCDDVLGNCLLSSQMKGHTPSISFRYPSSHTPSLAFQHALLSTADFKSLYIHRLSHN